VVCSSSWAPASWTWRSAPRTFAAATATVIYEFVTPVPAALPLFASALGLLALGRRRG
jgi:hypothetical protein